jgi:hypothetical protein
MSDLVGVPCSVCSERGHHSRKCPDLTDPLRPGFSGANGGGGHGGGDEDEKLSFLLSVFRLDDREQKMKLLVS